MNEEKRSGWRLLPMDDEVAGILAYAVDGGEISERDLEPIWARFASGTTRRDRAVPRGRRPRAPAAARERLRTRCRLDT